MKFIGANENTNICGIFRIQETGSSLVDLVCMTSGFFLAFNGIGISAYNSKFTNIFVSVIFRKYGFFAPLQINGFADTVTKSSLLNV